MAEHWFLKNKTKRVISIGDLQRVPYIDPGRQVDLLEYVTKQEIGNSSIVTYLLKSNKAVLTKTGEPLDSPATRCCEMDALSDGTVDIVTRSIDTGNITAAGVYSSTWQGFNTTTIRNQDYTKLFFHL